MSAILLMVFALSTVRADALGECRVAIEQSGMTRSFDPVGEWSTDIGIMRLSYAQETCVRCAVGAWGRLEGEAKARECVACCRAGYAHGPVVVKSRGGSTCVRICKNVRAGGS